VEYASERTHRGAASGVFEGHYSPVGEAFSAQSGSLEHFLTERYCLYTADSDGGVLRGEIHHAPWPLEAAKAELRKNTMAKAAGFSLPAEPPLLHFSKRQDVVVWQPQRLAR
jgi:uncharacterized protein YqjF (DUF2071 family)